MVNINSNIRNAISTEGINTIASMEQKIADQLKGAAKDKNGMITQEAMLDLQRMTTNYGNMVSLLTTVTKNLADTDKEVIRNV